MDRRHSDHAAHSRPPNSSRLPQNYGGPSHHVYGGHTTTNADSSLSSPGAKSSSTHHWRQSAQQHGGAGEGRVREPRGSQSTTTKSPYTNTGSTTSTTKSTGVGTSTATDKQRVTGNPSTDPEGSVPLSQGTSRRSLGRGLGRGTVRERSLSVESTVEIGGGMKGRMRDVEDDAVLISVNLTGETEVGKSELTRAPLGSSRNRTTPTTTICSSSSSEPPGHTTSSGSRPSAITAGSSGENGGGHTAQEDPQPLIRQVSDSDEVRSGQGIVEQPESSQFQLDPDHVTKAKALPGERSFDFIQYRHTLSKTSSSGSSYERQPSAEPSSKELLSQLKTKHDEEVTRLTERLSVVEAERDRVTREKEKLERKFKEAENVVAQASSAGLEISRLEAELRKEKGVILRLLRERQTNSASSEDPSSLQLSQELESMRSRLEEEELAKEAIQQELNSLKQTLVVGGQGEVVNNTAKLCERVRELEGTVGELERTLSEKESEAKRQTQVQSRTIADLQTKLSREREQREEIRQSTGPHPHPSGSTSPDVAEMAERLREKEREVGTLTQQLQALEKTAKEVAMIIKHSRQQSKTVATLKQELLTAQETVGKRDKESQEELSGMRTHYENTLRLKNTELGRRGEELDKMRREVGELRKQLTQQTAAVEEGKTKRSEVEQALQVSEKECNHWKQKSMQQDMVLQTKTQEVERMQMEMNGLRSTVSAQGKEVERLQRENRTLLGEADTHRITAMTYKEDFESERKDREMAHNRIADMETRYRHQLGSMGEQLQKVTEEAKRHRESAGKSEDLLQQQRQQVTAQLHQKEEEIHILQEEVMSKTQQVKQYKKQIDQLSTEVSLHRQQAEAHKSQIEFYAKKTEDYGKQRTFRELQERKIVELEAHCDQLRAENNEYRARMEGLNQQASGGGLQSRTPLVKSQTLGGPPIRPPDGMQALPNRHAPQGHPGPRTPTGVPFTHHQFPNHQTAPPHNHHIVPYSVPAVTSNAQHHHHLSSTGPRPAPMQHKTLPPAPQFQRHDSPYSSLPSSGLGVFGGPQQQQRPSGPVYSPPAGEMVDKDSPPSSIIGQEFQTPPAGQQKRAHSQMLSMTTRPSLQQQPPHIYCNLPLPHTPSNTAVPGSGGGYLGSQRRQSGPPSAVMRPPHTQDVAVTRRGSQQSQFSTPTEESRGRRSQKKPQLEGYIQPQQASPHTLAGQCLAVETLIGGGSVNQHHSGSPTPNSGDISKGIDRVIEETVSKVREEEEVVEGDDGEGIPYDPNLVCPKCRMRFREGEIQKFRRHVSSAHK